MTAQIIARITAFFSRRVIPGVAAESLQRQRGFGNPQVKASKVWRYFAFPAHWQARTEALSNGTE
jgi:hypothetical protein